MRLSTLVPLGLLVVLTAVPAGAQYLFLDSNGDGVHDSNDALAPSGPTNLDVWYVTDKNRDGTPAVCDVDAGVGLTINSYTFVLHAVGGDVQWGPMQNRFPFTHTPVCFATYSDTTNASYYHNGWGSYDILPPGRYKVATLTVEVTSGSPSLFFEPFLPSRPVQLTQFGTKCPARDDDNTYKLGSEWSDADGIGPMRAEAGGPYRVQAGRPLSLSGSLSRSTTGHPISYSWSFGDGETGTGENATHVYAAPGDYTAVLTAQSGDQSDTDEAQVHVVETRAPIAYIEGPRNGYVGIPYHFDGRTSVDPEGDPLTFGWIFGDGITAPGSHATHIWASAGTFTLSLTVSDGLKSDTASQPMYILPVPHPPVPAAGGPYSGFAGRVVQFDARASSDPDGDALEYAWFFGDRTTGSGVITGHSYEAPGTYNVRLTVSDGYLRSSTMTTAVIAGSIPARVFGNQALPVVNLGSGEALTLHVEPDHGSFRLDEVVLWPVTIHSSGTGSIDEVASTVDAVITEDVDQNGQTELTVDYSAEEVALLFANVPHAAVVTLNVAGSFYAGGSFVGEIQVLVQREGQGAPGAPLRVSPNPFNPDAVVTFSTSKPGPVRAQLYDVRGRMVRTVIQDQILTSGPHAIALSARADNGNTLASGVYFFRLTGPDGVTTKRVAVAK
jgi:PKD repeat protein